MTDRENIVDGAVSYSMSVSFSKDTQATCKQELSWNKITNKLQLTQQKSPVDMSVEYTHCISAEE